jgi:hypothetical protein
MLSAIAKRFFPSLSKLKETISSKKIRKIAKIKQLLTYAALGSG